MAMISGDWLGRHLGRLSEREDAGRNVGAAEARRTGWGWLFDRLGYGVRRDPGVIDWRTEDPAPGDWRKPGAFVTETLVVFGWRDRLRLLVSGRVLVETSSKTDAIIRRAETRAIIGVLPPRVLLSGGNRGTTRDRGLRQFFGGERRSLSGAHSDRARAEP